MVKCLCEVGPTKGHNTTLWSFIIAQPCQDVNSAFSFPRHSPRAFLRPFPANVQAVGTVLPDGPEHRTAPPAANGPSGRMGPTSEKAPPLAVPSACQKTTVIANQPAGWCGDPPDFRKNCVFQTPNVASIGGIPTPVCALARNDHFFDSLKAPPLAVPCFYSSTDLR